MNCARPKRFVDLSERFAAPLLALMGVVAVVLLIACSNSRICCWRADGARREIQSGWPLAPVNENYPATGGGESVTGSA